MTHNNSRRFKVRVEAQHNVTTVRQGFLSGQGAKSDFAHNYCFAYGHLFKKLEILRQMYQQLSLTANTPVLVYGYYGIYTHMFLLDYIIKSLPECF